MRAIIHHDCMEKKFDIYRDTVMCMNKHPDMGHFTLFNYVSAPPTIEVYPLSEASAAYQIMCKTGAECHDTIARVERSGRRYVDPCDARARRPLNTGWSLFAPIVLVSMRA